MLHVLSQFVAGRIKQSCVTTLGMDPRKPVASFPKTSPHMPFPFADFAWYHVTVINHSCEYYYMLNPVSPPSKPRNLGPLTQLMALSFLAPPVQPVKPFIICPYHSPEVFTEFQCMPTTSVRPPWGQWGFIAASSQPGMKRLGFCSSFLLFCYFLFNSE